MLINVLSLETVDKSDTYTDFKNGFTLLPAKYYIFCVFNMSINSLFY